MERRRVSRHPCRQDVRLSVEGRDNPGTALDTGLGRARVSATTVQGVGVGTRVVVHWSHRGATLDLAGAVARVSSFMGGHEVSIVFDVSTTSALDGLQARFETAPAR